MSFWNKVKETAERAKEAASQIEFKEAFENARDTASSQISKVKESSSQKYEQYYPKIEQVILRGLIGFSEEKLKDDDFVEGFFNKAFEVLPVVVRLALPRDVFLNFCHKNKEKLLSKAMQYKENNLMAIESGQDLDTPIELDEPLKTDET